MEIDRRINAFDKLGDELSGLSEDEFQSLAGQARNQNPWFTERNVRMALDGIIKFLDANTLKNWISKYKVSQPTSKKIALVMAGNIPLVGFHDFLCVLMAGHKAIIKLSSKDNALMTFVINRIVSIEPRFKSHIIVAEQLKDFDAVIATGSDNSARYFNYYFGKYPHIIRKNRTSVAILSGRETEEDLKKLGTDVFSYFGLGCRNVSKIFVPHNYDFNVIFKSWQSFQPILYHHKYANNYDYQKSILLVNKFPFLDNEFVLLQESDKIVSPISILYYQCYHSKAELKDELKRVEEKIQCVVGDDELSSVSFGESQYPSIDDYADGVDTMKFLTEM